MAPSMRFRLTTASKFIEVPKESLYIPSERLGLATNSRGFSDGCVLGITGFNPEGSNQAIIGTMLFDNYFTVYNKESQQIGLAVQGDDQGFFEKGNLSKDMWLIVIAAAAGFLLTGLLVMCMITAF